MAIAADVQGKIHIRLGVYVQPIAILYNKGACDRSNHAFPCKGRKYHPSRLNYVMTQLRYPTDLPVVQMVYQIPQQNAVKALGRVVQVFPKLIWRQDLTRVSA